MTDSWTYGQTDGRTPDRYITLTARRGQHIKVLNTIHSLKIRSAFEVLGDTVTV